jgi:putative oxidoreductase
MNTAVAERGLISRIALAYEAFTSAASLLESPFLLAIRLYWGWQFAETGWGKLQHLPKVTNFFTSLGIPFPAANAVFVSWLEFIGGILLGIGLFSRPVALLLATDMFVAYLTAGRDDLMAFFSNPGKFYGDDAFTFLLASLIVLVFGSGKFSLDALKLRRP